MFVHIAPILVRMLTLTVPLMLAASLAQAASKPDIPGIIVPDIPSAISEKLKSEKRLALVIGNGNYPSAPLKKPSQDAKSFGQALRYVGYEVEILQNLSGAEMDRAVDQFIQHLRKTPGATGLVYFSGHGVQLDDGKTYLVPVDLPEEESYVRQRATLVERVVGSMEVDAAGKERSGVNIVLMDGCRNNPWVKALGGKAYGDGDGDFDPKVGSRGFKGSHSFVGFATTGGAKAQEGDSKEAHSVFTHSFLEAMFEPGRSLVDVFKSAQDEVYLKTEKRQLPRADDALRRAAVYFVPQVVPKADTNDEAAWSRAQGENTATAYRRYEREFPKGAHLAEARVAAQALERLPAQPTRAEPPTPQPQQVVIVSPPPVVWEAETAAPPGVIMLKGRWKEPGSIFKECRNCPEMVIIPAGSFMMGAYQEEQEWQVSNGVSRDLAAREGPQREVVIARSFAAGRFTVTFEEWDACVGGGGCKVQKPADDGGGRGRHPVINVSWNDAQAYVHWLNGKARSVASISTGGEGRYRLLTEAEWEYAARAGTTTLFYTGQSIAADQANFYGNFTPNGVGRARYLGKTMPVGSFAPNGFGLYDMAGNVWQWVEDCIGEYRFAPSDGSAATGKSSCKRVLRGGSWINSLVNLRSASRISGDPHERAANQGFRLARTLP